jgi:branched-chain amino acid transport system substrate-binding protein
MIGYNGIKHGAKGQNTLAAALLVQLVGKEYVAVWPDKSAVQPPALPFKGWNRWIQTCSRSSAPPVQCGG